MGVSHGLLLVATGNLKPTGRPAFNVRHKSQVDNTAAGAKGACAGKLPRPMRTIRHSACSALQGCDDSPGPESNLRPSRLPLVLAARASELPVTQGSGVTERH